jgi:GntR family transcriptional regulator
VLKTGLEVLESIETLAKRIELPVSSGKVQLEQRQATKEECDLLALEPGCTVISVSRVILAEGRPVAYLVDILPDDVLSPDEVQQGFSGSVLDLLLERGNPKLVNSHCEIAAVAANSTISRALHIQRGDAILKFSSRLFALDGRVIDYSYSYFLPGYFKFHVVRELTSS